MGVAQKLTRKEIAANPLIEAILGARRIALYGAGREGLAIKGFAMRLFHMGRDAHVVGDMTTPPVGKGDLLMASAGPGCFSTVMALLGVAREAGARSAGREGRRRPQCRSPPRGSA